MAQAKYTGYAGLMMTGITTSIANGQTKSAVISMLGFNLAMIALPAAFTGTALTFEVCDTSDGTFNPLYDKSGSLVSMTVAQGRTYTVDPALFNGAAFLKIVSGSSEGAARTLTLSMKG